MQNFWKNLNKNMIYKTLVNSAATSKMLEKRMPLMIDKNYNPPTASFNIFITSLKLLATQKAPASIKD